MNMRLLTTLIAAAALGGCATYDYVGGSAPGGYYHGRPSVEYYGPYGGDYGYPGYGYGGYYQYGYGYRDPYGYYGGYYPYYPYRPHRPRPPRPERPDPPADRVPQASRNPEDGRYRVVGGQARVPGQNRGVVPAIPNQPRVRNPERPAIRNPGVRQRDDGGEPQQLRRAEPSAPRVTERPRSVERVERAAPERRTENRDRVRTAEP